MLLRAIDGVYLGMLLLNLEVAAPPADEVLEILGIVGAGMAALVDRLAPALQFVSMHSPRLPAAALDQVHGWMPLTADGLPAPALLDAVTDVLSRTDRPARFRWCDRDGDRRGRRSRLQPLTVELFPSSSSTCRAVMSWRQEPLPYGLTRRELDVLAAMVTGA
ncbi:hypothetical protein P9990_25880 (plasmid) [Prescottella equi]|uniref:hypothetical protein n=1 Tax=Rhodococcus hoagii TaxID=43767 RepID=UPI0025782616|nr:hypothetical protein [Prescottella equi]WJJ14621.1 hypothetical protein P9990_25880 [Prescottella equi]